MQCFGRISSVLRAPPVEVVQQVKPAGYERPLEDCFALPMEDTRSADFVRLEDVVDGVVMPLKRHDETTAFVPWHWVMGSVDWTVIGVVEVGVGFSIPVEDTVDKLLRGCHGWM